MQYSSAAIFLAAAGFATWTVVSDPDRVTDAEADGLELFFIEHFPEWGSASCRDDEVDGQHFINCRPTLSDAPGALFLLEPGKAVAVNGKAMQWSERGRVTYQDGKPLSVERLSGGGINVAAVIDELR